MTRSPDPAVAHLPRAAAGILLVLVAGCAAVPKLGPAPVPASPGSLASGKSLAAAVAEWPHKDWWKRYGDTQLDGLIAEALARAPTLEAAAARVRAAEAAVGTARAADLPQLSVAGSFAETKASYYNGVSYAAVPKGVNDAASLRATLDWNLDFFGRNRAAIAAAVSQADAARAEEAQTRLVLSTGVAAAYADLLGQMRDLDLARDTLAVRERTADLVERRRTGGLETLASSAQATSALESAKQALAAQEEMGQLTRLRIAALLGTGPDRALAITRPTDPRLAAFGLPANLPADLVGRRPDVRAARLRVEARAAQIRQARAGFYPSINLSAFLGPQVLGLGQFFNDASLAGGAGPAISLPIFRGGALSAQYRGTRASYDEAVASYDDTLVHALSDVAQAATSQRALARQLAHANAARDAAEIAYRAARDRYRGGLSNYIAVLTAENTLIASRRAVTQLETRAFALDVALVRALGGGA
ncbi:efflux transporter outer membrane subunit [Sphingomonas sp. BK235]|uniref:efflux transporter outer membrane subunit n=1 Tax=Sphingomonas sp. BK235 TaxID=2512131 RepID=UPI001053BEBA|nr:efflux transporter outer membrane subunit [Sphingomonas sp. BK235]TCP32446.1 NodT family efflux transporter outer membrane factor (OMF) lipoprotein [Sphingomonas sp. BK235]